MKICFVGHTFHERTRSSAFFQTLLSELGTVNVLSSSPDAQGGRGDDAIVEHFVSSTYDLWVFWQTEYIAERLVPLGLRNALIVPMYDGAWGRKDDFFRRLVNSRFLSFSRALHTRLQRLDCRSAFFEYFPEPLPEVERSFEKTDWSAFFWERRPRETPNAHTVLRQCRAFGIARAHLHLAPDFERDRGRLMSGDAERIINGVATTTSHWFDDPAQYREVSRGPQFYFAPRLTEGIGMAMLEAMAAGQVVVAPDRPTANQYIGHLSSGLLYDPERPLDLPRMGRKRARAMSAAARLRVAYGHEDFARDRDRLISYILDDGRRWSSTDPSAAFANTLRARVRSRRLARGRGSELTTPTDHNG